jgi:glycosyltransferase involved in cell wall biosynthesis
VGGLLDAVADGETGVLVPPRDVDALRDATSRLLADPALRQRLGDAARAVACARYGAQQYAEAAVRAYRDASA